MMRKKDMGKYFGTDGFRGEANKNLTADHAYKIGRFLGWYYSELKHQSGDNAPARIVIGKDTRRSSYMFEYSLVGGLVASGADAYLLHVTTTPSVAYVARVDEFDCGIMISASHNPYYDNGIKLINGNGEKMDEDTISLVEAYLDGNLNVFGKDYAEIPYAHRDRIGCTVDYVSGRNRYVGYLISLGVYSFKGMKVGLDCANGSSWNIAKAVFDALGAKTYVINADPNGTNINTDAGSTHIEGLQRFVIEKGLDVGFAYDGDADRCLCVDEKGNVVDGDAILYVYGRYLAGILVQRRSGTDLVSYLMPRLFKHLEIKRPTWEIDPLGNTFGAGGLFLTLSELHKFGLFYLNKGKWNGKQLLNAAWIEESTKPSDTEQYGYLFWRGKYNSYRADGKYSQLSIVLPDADAVVSLVAECRKGEELTQAINDLICAQL